MLRRAMALKLLGLLIMSVDAVVGHGFLLKPVARQPGVSSLDVAGTVCKDCSCCWYTNQVASKGAPKICDRNLLTSGIAAKANKACGPYDFETTKPWRSPGTAPIHSPCGNKMAHSGDPGTALPPAEQQVWQQGATVEVAMAITANHGVSLDSDRPRRTPTSASTDVVPCACVLRQGGYSYRICPRNSQPTEACFQANSLRFATNTTTVRKRTCHHGFQPRHTAPTLCVLPVALSLSLAHPVSRDCSSARADSRRLDHHHPGGARHASQHHHRSLEQESHPQVRRVLPAALPRCRRLALEVLSRRSARAAGARGSRRVPPFLVRSLAATTHTLLLISHCCAAPAA
jgi:hypothetical protein